MVQCSDTQLDHRMLFFQWRTLSICTYDPATTLEA